MLKLKSDILCSNSNDMIKFISTFKLKNQPMKASTQPQIQHMCPKTQHYFTMILGKLDKKS